MAKILIFGASSVPGLPAEVIEWIRQYTAQGHEFIVGDKKGLDCAIHKTLSSLGALANATIYSMDEPNNNLYGIKVRKFETYYDEEGKRAMIKSADGSLIKNGGIEEEAYIIEDIEKEMDIRANRKWYEFKDRQMVTDCDVAICMYDGESKGVLHMIQLLGIQGKQCYTFTFN